jgi:hypothetical protein
MHGSLCSYEWQESWLIMIFVYVGFQYIDKSSLFLSRYIMRSRKTETQLIFEPDATVQNCVGMVVCVSSHQFLMTEAETSPKHRICTPYRRS